MITEHGLSQRTLAKQTGISQPRISQALALLGLPESVAGAVEAGVIPPSTAYAITQAPAPVQADLAERAVREKLTRAQVVREVEAVRLASPPDGDDRPARPERQRAREIQVRGGWRIQVERGRGFSAAELRAALLKAADQVAIDDEAAAA